jgi:hypothetical protein
MFKESRQSSNPIEVHLDSIIDGKEGTGVFSFVTLKGSFFLNIVVYAFCFIVLWVNLRRLSRYNKLAVKANIKMSD